LKEREDAFGKLRSDLASKKDDIEELCCLDKMKEEEWTAATLVAAATVEHQRQEDVEQLEASRNEDLECVHMEMMEVSSALATMEHFKKQAAVTEEL